MRNARNHLFEVILPLAGVPELVKWAGLRICERSEMMPRSKRGNPVA